MGQDLRLAIRLLRRNSGFATAALLTIALGVALNGAVFALVRSVLLRPLPFRDPDRVVVLWQNRAEAWDGTLDQSDSPQTAGLFSDWRAYGRSFDGVAGIVLRKFNLELNLDLVLTDRAERLRGAMATPNLFTVMGVQAALGRVFSEADGLFDARDDAKGPKVALVSQSFARAMAPGSAVLGRRLMTVNGDDWGEIVGIVGDVRTESIAAEPMPAIYRPRAQDLSELICLVIRTAPGQLQSVAASARATIHAVDPTLPVQHVTTLDEIVAQSIADRRFTMAATTSSPRSRCCWQ